MLRKSGYDPTLSHFDIDLKRGAQAELFVKDIQKMLASGTGEIEVKADERCLDTGNFYIEYECQGRDGKWRKSGICVTKAKILAITLGPFPCVVYISVEWMLRACKLAWKDTRNRKMMQYGENWTKGVLVRWEHILKTVDSNG